MKEVKNKICTTCKTLKDLEMFHNHKGGRLGKKSSCKKCISLKSKIYESENVEKIRSSRKIQYQKNKEAVKARVKKYADSNSEKLRLSRKMYRLKNKEKLNEYFVKRNKSDKVFYLKTRIRKSIYRSIKENGFDKLLRTENILGCDFDFFIKYIESQFKEGMHWSNIHIDHIMPLAVADTLEKTLELNHYTNLQPLLSKDNIAKGSKIISKQLKFI